MLSLGACSDCNTSNEQVGSSAGSTTGDSTVSDVVDEPLGEPPPNVRATYAEVRRAVSTIGDFGAEGDFTTPCISGHRVVCEVDSAGRVHVMRLPKHPEPLGTRYPQALEYAVVDGRAPVEPAFHTIAKIYGAESPELFLQGSRVLAGVIGTLHPGETSWKDPAFLTFSIADGEATDVSACIDRTRASARLALSGDRVLALSQQYVSPVNEAEVVGLRVHVCRGSESSVLTAEVPGTYRRGTYPYDYAVYSESSGHIHIIYEGVRGEAASPMLRLWDVVLDGNGNLVAERALASAADNPFFTRVFAGPDGSLHVFELYGKREGSGAWFFGRRILPLGVTDAGQGAPAHFIVDPWLGVHALWFEGSRPRWYGPEKPHAEAPR